MIKNKYIWCDYTFIVDSVFEALHQGEELVRST